MFIKLLFTAPLLAIAYTSLGYTQIRPLDTRWQMNALVPENGRSNILDLDLFSQASYIYNGKIHTQIYPVTVTGSLVPLNPSLNFLDHPENNPLRMILKSAGAHFTGINSFDDFQAKLGLHPYPKEADTGVFSVPYPNAKRPDDRLGFGIQKRYGAEAFTYSCAACHSANLFGKTVLGLTNRFPMANQYFVRVKKFSNLVTPLIDTWLFDQATGATPAEKQIIKETFYNINRVGAKPPVARGLDTSLAQVALSLNLRLDDEWATPSEFAQLFPRPDAYLDHHPADSKPAVWWNLKYKNRWLSDGSVIQGNPIITNILWNEIGRGTDLKKLSEWFNHNQKTIDEITAAVFSIEPPRFTDFFTEDQIDLARAKKGEVIFNNRCSKCHGVYEKNWNQPGADSMSVIDQIKNFKVTYAPKKPVIDVGTDPSRYLGMKSLEQLNKLKISKDYQVVIQAQTGYVPPPLVGIWARWPYFHNNSAPSLCAVLTPHKLRPKTYFSGEAISPKTDFDMDCNGYPLGEKTPLAWRTSQNLYDTSKEGLHNTGHDERIFMENGIEILSREDKTNLIKFLQTL